MENQEDKVSIIKDDVKHVRDFFKHFNIPLPGYLSQVLDTIDASENITLQHQAEMKTAIARAMVENSDHDVLKDELFEEVLPNCQKEWFDKQFEQQFEQQEVDTNK